MSNWDTTNQPRRKRRRGQIGSASLLLIGLLIGLASTLLYAWVWNPVAITTVMPAQLSPAFKQEYLFLVSQSYAVEGDLAQAKARLDVLKETNQNQFLSDQLATFLREGRRPEEVRNLATLAKALGVEGQVIAFFGPTAVPMPATETPEISVPAFTPTTLPTLFPTFTPTLTPLPSPTPSRTPRPTATPVPAFRLLTQRRACLPDEQVNRIEIETLDAQLEPLPGVEVIVSWQVETDHFFTGFKRSQGAGYGDFEMEKGVSYQLSLAEGSPTISGLQIERCPVGKGGLDGGWRLTFQQLTGDVEDEVDE